MTMNRQLQRMQPSAPLHFVPERQSPTPTNRGFHDPQPSICERFGRRRALASLGSTATLARKGQMNAIRVRRGSLPSGHEIAGFVGQAAVVQHQSSHRLVGAGLDGLGECRTHIVNGAKRDGKAVGVVAKGLGVHDRSPVFLLGDADDFARHNGDLLAGRAADVLVLPNQRAIAAKSVVSLNFTGMVDTLDRTVAVSDDRSVGLTGSEGGGDAGFDGVGHLVSPFVEFTLGPLALSVNTYFSGSP